MVWKGSKEFGIGKAITRENKVILVGQYKPPGNIIGQYEDNVFPRDDGFVPPKPDSPSKVGIFFCLRNAQVSFLLSSYDVTIEHSHWFTVDHYHGGTVTKK